MPDEARIVKISEYVCHRRRADAVHEETTDSDEIAIVHRGCFEKADRSGRGIADPTHIVLFRREEPFQVRHLDDRGDRETVFRFGDHVLADALDARSRDQPSLFTGMPTTLPATPRLILLARLLRSTGTDSMPGEELGIQLIAEFVRSAGISPQPEQEFPNSVSILADDVRAFLNAHFCEPLTLAMLADTFGVTEYRLCRVFRKRHRTTVHRHLTALRMAAALDRVCDRRESLAAIACDLGFSSHSHFTTTFRAWFGVVPSALCAGAAGDRLRRNLKEIATQLC